MTTPLTRSGRQCLQRGVSLRTAAASTLTLRQATFVPRLLRVVAVIVGLWLFPSSVNAADPIVGEITPESTAALEQGLEWLARNQGPEGNWQSNDLGLVSMGALAFLAAGHLPNRGPYGEVVAKALDHVTENAQASGLLNVADAQRDMYNHGLSAFVLGQAYGMTSDKQLAGALERSLRLIAETQCEDGGWDYRARRLPRGHDLSLAVMQAKALRSAMDCGFNVREDVVRLAVRSVREHYKAENGAKGLGDPKVRLGPGQFTYEGNRYSTAMAAAGVVCLQEFGQYDDWRIPKNMDVLLEEIGKLRDPRPNGNVPFDAYTLYYVGQALYQRGGEPWQQGFPILREHLTLSQVQDVGKPENHGSWRDNRWLSGRASQLYGTSVACFVLAIPNRYLPILQEGRITGLAEQLNDQ